MNILKLIRYKVISGMELQIVKYKFKKHNRNNKLRIMTIIPDNVTKCGNYSYGPIELYTDSDKYKLVIGSFCSIASNVSFLLDVEHNTN